MDTTTDTSEQERAKETGSSGATREAPQLDVNYVLESSPEEKKALLELILKRVNVFQDM